MMNTDGMAGLLAEILGSQIESGAYGEMERGRIYEALTTGPGFTEQEKTLLLLSPLAREDFFSVQREISEEIHDKLAQFGVETELLPLAAADREEKIVLKNSGFSVTLYRRKDAGVHWVILVQLEMNYKRAIQPRTILRLVDSGGLEWMRGNPDDYGEMSGAWYAGETDLLDRARLFSLILEPV